MSELSQTELIVAENYGRGFIDKEVAECLNKPVWTIKTHKKNIYQKLGISTTHELIIYLVCRKLEKPFDLKEIRKRGLSAILSILLLFVGMTDVEKNAFIRPVRSSRTTIRVQRSRIRLEGYLTDETD